MKIRRPRRKLCLPCNHPIHPPGHCDRHTEMRTEHSTERKILVPCRCSGPNSKTMTPEAALAHLNRKATTRRNNAVANDWQRRMVAHGQYRGWLVHHQRPGMTKSGGYASQIMGDRGFLDTVYVHPVQPWGMFIAEAKTGDATLTPEERRWFNALRLQGHEAYIFKPEDEFLLIRRLSGYRFTEEEIARLTVSRSGV